MPVLGLRPNQLRADNVANAVRHEDGGRHEALLCMAGHVRHPQSDDEADGATKEARDGVSDDGGGGVEAPGALPDDGTAGDDGQASEYEHEHADVVDL